MASILRSRMLRSRILRSRIVIIALWALASAPLAVSMLGCNPATLNFLLMPFADDRVPAKLKLAASDREVQVAVVTRFAYLETRPELMPVEMELSEKIGQALRERCKENKEKIKIIPISRVKSVMNTGGEILPHEIGKQLKADYVINLEITSMSLYERGSNRMLFRGNTEIAVDVFDVSKPSGEAKVWENLYRCEYPGSRGPIDAAGSSYQAFRSMFLTKIGRDISRNFTASQPDEDRRMID